MPIASCMSCAHPPDLVAELVVEASTSRRAGAQHRVAELADVRERRAASRADLGIERAASFAASTTSSSLVARTLEPSALRGYWGSTSTLSATPGSPRSRATASTAAPTARTAARAVVALTTSCARSRPRRRNSGAGPSAPASARARIAPPPRSRGARSLGGADDPHQRRERRIARAPRGGELARQEAVGVVARGERIDAASGAERLDEHRAARARRAPPGRRAGRRARTSAPRRGSRGTAASRPRRRRRRASTSGKSWPLATICVPTSTARSERSNAPQDRPGSATSASRRKTRRRARARSCSRRSVPVPWRATLPTRTRCTRSGTRSRWPQWWQASVRPARCRTSDTSQFGQLQARPQTRQPGSSTSRGG